MNCQHAATRLFAWFAYDGTLVICCCDCGAVLTGGADESEGDSKTEDEKGE